MNITYKLKLATLSAFGMLSLAGCSLLNSSKASGSEGTVVTLADGKKVVVSGQKSENSSETVATSTKSSDSTSKKESTSSKKESTKSKKATSTNKKSGSSADAKKSSKTEKTLSHPKSEKNKKSVSKKDSGKKKTTAVVKSDRQTVDATSTTATAQTAASASSKSLDAVVASTTVVDSVAEVANVNSEVSKDDFSINGEWTIYSVRGNLVTGEERPYVTFDIAASRFYGNNGCNYINGDLTVGDDRSIKMENMISTLKLCENDQFQYLINLALNDVVKYVVREESPITFLDMKDNTGRVILVLRRHNMDFLNGAWQVTDLNAKVLEQDDDATMTFDTTDLKIHGTTGCNIFNGELFIDPDKTNSLQIIKLVTTRMSCPNISRETEFLLGLEEVETAVRSGASDVVLYDQDGQAVFKLVKMDLRDESDED